MDHATSPTPARAASARADRPAPGPLGAALVGARGRGFGRRAGRWVGLSLLAAMLATGCGPGRAEGGVVAPPLPFDGSDFYAVAAEVPLAPLEPLELPGLHNVFKLSERVISGAEPEGEEAFRELAEMGVATILSVDGKQPDAAAAARHGLTYVHVPIQYSGIADDELAAITKTFREQQGPFYVHCFHGKHRGPAAAAVGRLVLDGLERGQAIAEMAQWCGTSPDYEGLYATVASARIPSADETAALDFDFPSGHALDGVRGVMIPMPRHFDALKAVRPLGWAVDPSHPDLDPVHEAEILVELFDALAAVPDIGQQPADFRGWMTAGRTAAVDLAAALAETRAGLSPTEALSGPARERVETAFQGLAASCKACHAVYRD